ncbi:hypothetical protein MKZ38_007605 [Zalerion maritima]|uniref:tRNA-splicing endonuclease subunit Sen15 domain-containing protein n=1 Tax=Zalerion maritima TaxID=339359 RepID=A0AAD5S2X5_9PEZI|nr:hypothetical protein MKZ38_007605 [Zalerion maritima]
MNMGTRTDSRFMHLADIVKVNLELEQDWTGLAVHKSSPRGDGDCDGQKLLRPLLSGLPPKRLYIHPDDQIDMIKNLTGPGESETEWVLPLHQSENPTTISMLASLFDSLPNPPVPSRRKRIILASVHNDSTVVYYIVHDGLVKPRQN